MMKLFGLPPKYNALLATVFKLQKCFEGICLLCLVLNFVYLVKLRFDRIGVLAKQQVQLRVQGGSGVH